jgi:hypothetical protein
VTWQGALRLLVSYISRRPMPRTVLEYRVSKMADSDVCPRPTTLAREISTAWHARDPADACRVRRGVCAELVRAEPVAYLCLR